MVTAVAVGAMVASACGSAASSGSPDGRPGAGGSTVTTVSRHTSTQGLSITGIAAGTDPATLVATAAAVPVGDGPCSLPVQPSLEYEADRIYLTLIMEPEETITYEVRDEGFVQLGGESSIDGCGRADRSIEVAIDGPLANREVVTQDPPNRWLPGPGGTYSPCVLPACDPATGLAPAPAACGDATLPDAVRRGDVPRRAGIDVRACELPWAVVDIDVGAGACPATGEPGNPCAGMNIDRSYWKATAGGWEVLAYSSGAGCGDVLATLPELPARMCAGLPPVP
jgi:hypothetical protein